MKSKRLLLMLLLALCAPWAAMGQTVTIGTDLAVNNYNPIGTYYNYSFTEQLYLASEINQTGSILSLGFNYALSTSKDFPVQIYMKAVDATSLTTAISIADTDLVFDGTLSATSGWVTVELDTPFDYDGTQNLLIAVNKGYVYYFSGSTWCFTSTDNMACNAQRDGSAYTPTTSLPSMGTTAYRPNVQLTFGTPATCPKPTLSQDVTVTENSATITWTPSSDSQTLFDIYWSTENTAPTENTTPSATNQSGTSYEITGLTAATQYYAWIRGNCGTASDPDVSGGWTSSVSFATACESITTFPWSENFNSLTAGIPNCWDNSEGTTTDESYKWNYYANGHEGAGLRFNSYNNYTNYTNFLKTPTMDFPAETTMQLSFWYKNATGGDFSVYISTDGGETYTTELATGLTGQSSWTKQEIILTNYPGQQNVVIVFKGTSNYGNGDAYIYLDDVEVKEAPSCLPPTNLAATDITTNSAELSWTANSGETAWTVYYKTSSETDYTSVAATTNPYTLEGLTAATTYDYYVVANCSETEQSEASEVFSFTTECEIYSDYPYTENFDGYDVSSAWNPSTRTLPNCWSAINTTSYSSYAVYPSIYYYSSTNYANSTPNSLRLYSYYSSSYSYDPQPQYAILPEMENLAGKQITLSAKGYNASSTFKIGTMTDPADASTFSKIAEQALTTSYQEFIYNVPADATAHYIAIMIDAADEDRYTNSVYIDDITINLPPACPKPTDLAYSNVTTHTAQLSWTENGEATAWQICLNDDEENPIDADSNPFTLEDLEENTAYTAKVRSNCGDEQSEWSSTTVSFTTPIACPAPTGLAVSDITGHEAILNWTGTSEGYDVMYRTAAYADGFNEHFNTNSIPSGWTRYSGLVDDVIAGEATLSTTTSGWNTNSYALGTYNVKVNVFGTSINYWLVTPEITLNSGTDLSFDLALTAYNSNNAASGECTDDRFVVLVYANEAWTILREWNNSGSTDVYNNIATTGENVTISLANFVNQTVKIAFYGESTEYGGDNDLHIDNVCVGTQHAAGEWQTAATVFEATTYTLTGLDAETAYEVKIVSNCEGETAHETSVVGFTTDVACMAPTGLTASEVGPNSAKLSWTSTDATAWQIQVGEDEPIDVTENPYTLEGLQPETEYTVKVRANCGDDGYSEWSEAVNFTTLVACPVPTDLVVSNITSNSADLTWTGYTDSYIIQYNTAATMGNPIFSEDFSGDIDDWTLQDCAGSTGLTYGAFRFSWNTNPPQYLISPEITGITEDAILEFTYYNYNTNWEETFQVGLSSTDNATDSFTWSETITASDAEEHTYHATVPAGTKYMAIKLLSNNQYYLYIDDIVIAQEIAAGDPITVTSETESVTLSGLTPNTEYEVKVQGVCGDDETEWTEIVSFTTLMPSFTKEITKYTGEKDHYYLIASPIGTVAPEDVTNMLSNDYDLYSFDQTGDSDGKEWLNYENEEFTLESGKGYLYANSGTETSETVILTFTGVPCTDGTVTLSKDGDAYFSGWNLIGNPFAETAYIGRDFYVMNGDGSEIVASETTAIAPMEGVFVIAETDGEELTFTTDRIVSGSSLALNVTRNRGNVIDRALVRFGSDRSLPKFQLRESSTKVYIPQEGKDYAVVSAGNVGELPVNFKAEKNGSYTMSFTSEEVSFNYLHLIDNMTGTDVDLLKTPSYTFDALTTDYASRFKLVFATGNASDDDFAFFSNGSFVINNEGEATLQVIDVMGRILNSETINGCANVNVDAAPGVYMLRLINGSDVKVQKVVVR